jgi:membrane associated rhomboid family serine protease
MLKFMRLLIFFFLFACVGFVMGQMPAPVSPPVRPQRPQRPPTNYVAKFAGAVVGIFAVAYIWQLQRANRKK